ncbi:putative elongation factor [Lasius niger]|uniref:Putative elongation factor n=1 Tax=Lasius niger TaxID=67767 RepID=A0A0J7JYF1_LASNI|nr:putative elongation factor [Lasius niger]
MSSFSSEDAENESQSKTLKRTKARELHQNILSDLPPIPNSSGEISESVRFQYSHDVVEATGSKQVTKSHGIIRGARPKETEAFGKDNTVLNCENNGTSSYEDQCDIDEESEDVDDPYMTIPTPVAIPATRKEDNFSEVQRLPEKPSDGMEVMDRSAEGETDWTYWTFTRNI